MDFFFQSCLTFNDHIAWALWKRGCYIKWNKAKERRSLSVQPRASLVKIFEYILQISLCTSVDTALKFIFIISTDLWLL